MDRTNSTSCPVWDLSIWVRKVKKVKLSLCFSWAPRREGVLGSGGIVTLILNLRITWRWVVSFTPLSLYLQGKTPLYSLDRRLDGPQSRSRRDDVQKNSQPLPGLESSIIQLVAQRCSTNLSQLLIWGVKPPSYNISNKYLVTTTTTTTTTTLYLISEWLVFL
jgi:hypothetical protein